MIMAMGYCKKCDKLVPTRQGARQREGFSSHWWYPLPHDDKDGKPCDGEDLPI